ncbi:hypothetical protein [Nonomuraea sp. JJY05]|uniref:hypothetical protein n=1 Tax=Nonomuraea sp. JJY05 TaxID=3350255 RepID=UPI00373E175D
MIEIDALTKVYGSAQVRAVDEVSLRIGAGSVFGFLGPNGAGAAHDLSALVGPCLALGHATHSSSAVRPWEALSGTRSGKRPVVEGLRRPRVTGIAGAWPAAAVAGEADSVASPHRERPMV